MAEAGLALLTVDDVCARLRLSRRTVYKLIEAGELPSITIGTSRRFASSAVDAFIRSLIEGAA